MSRRPTLGYRERHGASHTGDGFGTYPRTCAADGDCLHGGKVKITGEVALQFETLVNARGVTEQKSWHRDCYRLVKFLQNA